MESSTLPPTCTVIHADGEPCSICKELAEMEFQIVQTARHLATLESKRIHLKSALNSMNDRIVGRLPLEIATYIFQFYLEVQVQSSNPDDVFPKNWMTDAPFRLGAVCRRWRAIAWASPALWTSFSICLYPHWNENMLELAKQWLGRTGSFPLSIRVYKYGRNYNGPTDDEEYEEKDIDGEVIDVVNSVSSRWQSLDIALAPSLLEKFHSLGDRACPSPSVLQRVSLTDASSDEEEYFEIHDFLLNNPGHSPTHLHLRYIPLGGSLGDFNWTNIIFLEVNFMTIQDCLLIIQAAPRLKYFTLGPVSWAGSTPSSTVTTHLGLRSLTFLWSIDPPVRKLLDRLMLPSLECLTSKQESGLLSVLDNLIPLIDRSSCHLKLLHLDFCSASNPELRARLLRSIPSLETLIMTFYRDSDLALFLEDLWKIKLDNSGPSTTFLPYLKTFETTCVSDLALKALLDIFESSQTSQSFPSGKSHMAPIQSLKFNFLVLKQLKQGVFVIDRDTLQRLMEFIAQGFNISITCNGENIIAKSLAIHFPRRQLVVANNSDD